MVIFSSLKPLKKNVLYVIGAVQVSFATKFQLNTHKNGRVLQFFHFIIYGTHVTTIAKCYFSLVLDVVAKQMTPSDS